MSKVNFQIFERFIQKMMVFYDENKKVSNVDVVLVGASLTEFIDDMSRFDDLNLKIMNRGIGSDKSNGILISLNDRVLALNPKIVHLLIGSNDICDGYSNLEILSNIKAIIKGLEGKKIIVGTVMPPCYYNEPHIQSIYPKCRDILKIKNLNEEIKKIVAENKDCWLLDTFAIMADENDSLRPEDTSDGVHLTKSGYDKYINELKELIRKAI